VLVHSIALFHLFVKSKGNLKLHAYFKFRNFAKKVNKAIKFMVIPVNVR